MLRALKNKIDRFRLRQSIRIDDLLKEVEEIRKRSDIIAITGKPYHHSWRGVFNGACGMFPGHLMALPHHYSRPILTDKQYQHLADVLKQLRFSKIVFTGFSEHLESLLVKLCNPQTGQPCYLIYHSSFSQFHQESRDLYFLKRIFYWMDKGYVRRIAFMKKGLAETFARLRALPSFRVLTMIPLPTQQPQPLQGLHIGVFSHESFRKNHHNQVAAALLFPEASVHVATDTDYSYFGNVNRLVRHSFTENHQEFLDVLGSMTLNFYTTFSECYGMIIAESLARGVPCVSSNSSGFFDWDPELGRRLVAADIDNPWALWQKAEEVLNNRDELSRWGRDYVVRLNAIGWRLLHDFLS
ncbi:MAG: hypothetical protein NZL95_09865 [Chitinophagales bacterium]|nr:hypothetical protein [Chitinophagales bacterium]MDW8428837.1 hypothetical protein [Chitinophagales bacterium]